MKEGGGAIVGDKNQFVVTSDHIARIVELYSSGIKSSEISRMIGCSKPTVTKYLRINGTGTRILGPKKRANK
jgi:DNA invertase Pin-like site-specific DNA recombinase